MNPVDLPPRAVDALARLPELVARLEDTISRLGLILAEEAARWGAEMPPEPAPLPLFERRN